MLRGEVLADHLLVEGVEHRGGRGVFVGGAGVRRLGGLRQPGKGDVVEVAQLQLLLPLGEGVLGDVEDAADDGEADYGVLLGLSLVSVRGRCPRVDALIMAA